MQLINYNARYSIFKSACLVLLIFLSSILVAIPGDASDSTLFRFIYIYDIEYILKIFAFFGFLVSIFFVRILARAIRGDVIVSINEKNVVLNFKKNPTVIPKDSIISLDSFGNGIYKLNNDFGTKAYIATLLIDNPSSLIENLRKYVDIDTVTGAITPKP
jgi:hypothetical protein